MSHRPGCAGAGPAGGVANVPAVPRKGYLQFLEEFSELFWFVFWLLFELRFWVAFWVVFLAFWVVFLALRLSMVLFSFQNKAS